MIRVRLLQLRVDVTRENVSRGHDHHALDLHAPHVVTRERDDLLGPAPEPLRGDLPVVGIEFKDLFGPHDLIEVTVRELGDHHAHAFTLAISGEHPLGRLHTGALDRGIEADDLPKLLGLVCQLVDLTSQGPRLTSDL